MPFLSKVAGKPLFLMSKTKDLLSVITSVLRKETAKLIVAKSKLLSLREHWSATCLDFGEVFLL